MQKKSDRVIFANQLRALAIVCVIIVHWCGIYWDARDLVASYIHAPAIEGPANNLRMLLAIPTLNYGPFGVSIFFLVSGFVIPFSLARSEPVKFLMARALRIYPTYIAASLIMLGLVYMSATYWGQAFTMSARTLMWNLLLVQNNVGVPTIDLVNWTLSVEIKFYIIAALLYSSIRKGNVYPIILFSVAVLAACQSVPGMWGSSLPPMLIQSLKTELMCVIFMFIGTGFYHHYTGTYTHRQLLSYMAILFILFLMCWPHTVWANQIPSVPQNYGYGLILFSVCYALRGYFRPIAPLDFLANISYSIYVLHSIIGYLSLRILMDRGFSFPVSGLLTLTFVIGLAYVLYRLVERPTMHLGKMLFTKNSPPEPVISKATSS